MKHLLKLAYKLGQLSYDCPKPSTKPFKAMYKEFKNGREQSKASKMSDINVR